MAENGADLDRKPPYVTFKTFENFIDKLRAGVIPSRIDKSFITLSGSNTSWLLSALKYLGLIEDDGTPTDALQRLVAADGDEQRKLFKELCDERYDFILPEIDLSKATTGQLESLFRNKGMAGSTVTKALAFFLSLAENGGYEVAPHIRRTGTSQRKAAPRKRKTDTPPPPPPDPVDKLEGKIPALKEKLIVGLIEKLPPPGTEFNTEDRELWIGMAGMVFQMVYKMDRTANKKSQVEEQEENPKQSNDELT